MDRLNLFQRIRNVFQGPSPIPGLLLIVMILVLLAGVALLATEMAVQSSRGEPTPVSPRPAAAGPAIWIAPAAGRPGAVIAVSGQGWTPGDDVLVGLERAADGQRARLALTTARVRDGGAFSASFTYPSGEEWTRDRFVFVAVWSVTSEAKAWTAFELQAGGPTPATPTPTETAGPPTEPPRTPTVGQSTATSMPAPPTVTATFTRPPN